MRLGRIFTWAAKGKNPEPGTFNFVESAAASDPFAASGTFASPGAPTATTAAGAESSPSSYGGQAGLGGGGDSGHLSSPPPPPPPVPTFFGSDSGGQGGEFGFGDNGDVGGSGREAGAESGFGDAGIYGSDSGGAGGAGADFVGGGGGAAEGLWRAGAGGAGDGWSQPPDCSFPDFGVGGGNGDGVVGEISGISGGGSSRHRGRIPGEMSPGAGAGAEGEFWQGGESSSPRPPGTESPGAQPPQR